MGFVEDFKNQLFTINENSFEDSSLAIFDYQYHQCEIYRQYCKSLRKNPNNVLSIEQIPFLPIEFFKNHTLKSGEWKEEKIFKSSGTTDTGRSAHYIKDISLYHSIAQKTFESIFGPLNEIRILALLPSYLEQGDSSLISMVDFFMQHSMEGSGYYLHEELTSVLDLKGKNMVIGVSYALLDAAVEIYPENLFLIETGGMKGRKKEITREELHIRLEKIWKPKEIWSEYGMTELMSQAYGRSGSFRLPPWSDIFIREIIDPFSYVEANTTGGINIIDLGNIHTCSFIETKDLGKKSNGFFEVLGRFDNSDIRGCNLMV